MIEALFVYEKYSHSEIIHFRTDMIFIILEKKILRNRQVSLVVIMFSHILIPMCVFQHMSMTSVIVIGKPYQLEGF